MRGYLRNRLTDPSTSGPVVAKTTLSRGYAISFDGIDEAVAPLATDRGNLST